MRDLAAQVTSSLLRFPEVTVDALGEDEVTLDSVLHGRFTVGRSGLAWLACGPQLEVVHSVTAERFSAYCFSSLSEHPPNVLAAHDFCWLKRTGLLVGLEEAEGSMLCLYDLGISRVVKAVVIPGRITAIEPIVSYGGASANTQHLHQSLRWFFGVAAVVTDIGHVLLVDLCLDDLSCSQSELEPSDLEVVNKSPSEIPRLREGVTQQGRHLCLQLNSPTGTGASAMQYIPRTNQLAVGFSDGYLQLWNMKTLKKEYHSQLEGGRVPVYAFTFQEPENDPRNCCYLWAVQSAQDLEGDVVSLHLLQLAYGERKCLASGKILYEGLEYCEGRYSQDLNGTAFPLRAQATNTRLLSCQTIEKFRHHPDRDDSMNEVASPDTSVSIFSWQVKSYGQAKPSTYISVFDINRWYHAQMPDSLRAGESLRNCPYFAVWSLDAVVEIAATSPLLDVLVHERSLSRGLPYTCPPPEQFFNPTTYNFDASCLLNSGIVHLTCSGHQKETLSYLKKVAPTLSESISSGYTRCLVSGLLSPRLADVQASNLSQDEQLDAILSTAVETSSLGLITGCIKQWTAEEQPGSAANLRYILEWAWDKVVHTKQELDGICEPLFDSSSNFTEPQTLQLLQHSQRLLGNLSTIFHSLLSQAQEITQKGLVGLINKNLVSSLIAQYSQVVLWFCRTGLLPEGSDDEDALQISRPFYSYSIIKTYYTGRREELQRLTKDKWNADCLMIDALVGQCGERLADLWKRDEGGAGQYPPLSLHALLDIYLLENIDESAKHAIVIYLLLDVMYSFPNKSGSSVESFPTAFAIPIGLVKLVQGLWLLDHRDHENSLELLLHPATSHSLWAWQHGRVLEALMCQGQHAIALRYLHVMKPSLGTTREAKLCLSVLLHNRCMVEAWALLRQHSNKLNMEELLRFLYETSQELDLMKELLKLPLGLTEQECLERFLQGTGGLQNRELLMVHYLQQANYVPALQLNQTLKMNTLNDRDPKMKERSNTRNSILDQYGKVLPRAQRRLATERAKPYSHPSTMLRKVSRPQPLSTVAKRSAAESVLTRATFISSVLSKIEEVWVGKDSTPESSSLKSPRVPEVLVPSPQRPPTDLPEAFVGTPITVTKKRMSRMFDLMVHPSCLNTPEPPNQLQTPPRTSSMWTAPKSIPRAPELDLLQTPQVVKRARALAASVPVFSSFTPQSILRSSLRPTPVATPSASPGRSVTPPLRPKESRITFVEEEEAASPELPKNPAPWSNGIVGDSEVSLSQRSSVHSYEEEEEEEGKPRVTCFPPAGKLAAVASETVGRDGSESASSSVREVSASMPVLARRPSLGHDTSVASVDQSMESTQEFHDAPMPEDLLLDQPKPTMVWEEQVDDEVIVVRRSAGKASKAEPSLDDTVPEEPPVAAHEENTPLTVEEEIEEEEEEKIEEQKKKEKEMDQEEVEECKSEPEHEIQVASESSGEMEVSVAPLEALPAVEEGECDPEVVQAPQEEEAEDAAETPEALTDSELLNATVEVKAAEAEELVCVSENAADVLPEFDHVPEQEPEPTTTMANHAGDPEESKPDVDVEENIPRKQDVTDLDIDAYVEHHLFDNMSPPRSPTRNWTTINSDAVHEMAEEQAPAVSTAVSTDVPMLTTQKSVASSEPTTSGSPSVVSVNDSEDLSSAASEDESDSEDEEEEDEEEEEEEEEEDSGSEVEIIEEVEGNGRALRQPPAHLYLEELPPHAHYLQEQTSAVLSLVSPEAQVEGIMLEEDEDEDEEVVMLGLGPRCLDEDDAEVSYTELKPPTTILVPLELAEDVLVDSDSHQPQHLLDEGALAAVMPVEPTATPAGGFSLMLEAEEEEEEEEVRERQAVEQVDAGGEMDQLMELPEVEEDQLVMGIDTRTQEQVDTPGPQVHVDTPGPQVHAQEERGTQVGTAEEPEDGDARDTVPVSVDAEMPTEGEAAFDASAGESEAEQVKDTPEAEVGQVKRQVQDTPEPLEAAGATLEEEEERMASVEDLAEVPGTEEESPTDMETQTEEPNENLPQEPNQAEEEPKEPAPEAEEEPMEPAPETEEEPREPAPEAEEESKEPAPEAEEESKEPAPETEEEPKEPAPETEEASLPQSSADADDPEKPEGEEISSSAADAEVAEVEEKSTSGARAEKGRSTRQSEQAAAAAATEIADTTYDIPPVSTRKGSSHRKNVTFLSPVIQVEKDLSANEGAEEQSDPPVPSTPRRSTRSGKQLPDVQVLVTPRRRTRRTEPEQQQQKEEEEEEEAPSASTTVNSKPSTSKRQTPQKATPRKGGRRTRSLAEEAVDEQPAVELPETGRQSTRKTRNTSILEAPEAPAVAPEAKAIEEPPRSASSSPGRVTRASARGVSLTLDTFQKPPPAETVVVVTPPRSRRKTRAGTAEKAKATTDSPDDTAPPSGTAVRRLTRGRHWKDMEGEEGEEKKDELGIMDTTVELVPGTPLGDALMERLQGEARGEVAGAGVGVAVTEIIRANRRTTRPAAPLTPVLEPEDGVSSQADMDADASAVAEPPESAASPSRRRARASKAPAPEVPTEMDTFTFTPMRRTRGRKVDSVEENGVAPVSSQVITPAPGTRTRRVPDISEPQSSSQDNNKADDVAKETKTSQPKKTRTTRLKASVEPPAPVTASLLSPLVMPEELTTGRTQRRVAERARDEDEKPAPRMNLRRKRVLDAIFPKPVARRKKL
ncbi:uncharacterized protein ahctf1 isoform X2 [Alosa pseudoharengus]|uniref:uncharacterized protein ahctf1 isoform X2 n=1 Tax=Alosa pseudoharengus TaxID=34774 RepID=UPI003F8CBEE5